MRNTPTTISALAAMAAACEGTPWELRFRCSDETDWVYTQLSTRREAPEFTPALYLDTDYWDGVAGVNISVQTTSYGPLNISEIEQVAAGLTQAALLARRLSTIAQLAGLRVRASCTL